MSPPKSLRPRGSSMTPATATGPSPSSSGKKKKVGSCGQCEACSREDCRQCIYCIDMRKYGGPNRLRKRCIRRRCMAKDGTLSQRETSQTTKSKRVVKQPKKLTPNHSAALSYDDRPSGEGEKRKAPLQRNYEPHSKRRKVETFPKKMGKQESAGPKSYGSGKRLAPTPSLTNRIPSPPNLAPTPSPIVARIKRRTSRPQALKPRPKVKKIRYVPKSLPFLVNTDIADVIVRYEIRARNSAVKEAKMESIEETHLSNEWRLEEIINLFRGMYLFGWGNWSKIQLMIKTRDLLQIENFADAKLQRCPEIRRFFGRNNLRKLHTTYANEKVKRLGNVVSIPSSVNEIDPATICQNSSSDRGLSNLSVAVLEMLGDEKDAKAAEEKNDLEVIEQEEEDTEEPDWLKDSAPPFLLRPHDPTRGTFNNGKVAICLGGRVIETDNSGLTQDDATKTAESNAAWKPEIFNPQYRPSAPTANSQQIYIPGNRVYARWLNADDPGSYGTWYPGFVQSSMVSPDQRDYDEGLCAFPSLLYQVRFDDGILSRDIKAEDIMMHNQYETWLKELEDYYSLSIPEEGTNDLLLKGQRVYAKWIDPTDPDMHARWIRGVVLSCNTDADETTYHVKFDDGDDDEEIQSEYVLKDSMYKKLLQQKIERDRNSHVSGIDLIHAASRIASPIRENLSSSSLNGSARRAILPGLRENDKGDDSCAAIENDLLCKEVLDSPSLIPEKSNEPSAPKVHYGLYMNIKPSDSVITPALAFTKKAVIPTSIKVSI